MVRDLYTCVAVDCRLSPQFVSVGECNTRLETLAQVFPLLEAVQPYVEGAHGRLMQCLAPSTLQISPTYDVPELVWRCHESCRLCQFCKF